MTVARETAQLYVRQARAILEMENHPGPHPLEDALEKLRDVEKTLGSVLATDPEESPETLED